MKLPAPKESAIHIVVPGRAVPNKRPRFSGHAYTDQKHREYHEYIRIYASEAMRGRKPLEGNLQVHVLVVFAIPKSWNKTKKQEGLSGRLGVGVPDIDNLMKNWDALNGIVFKDDKQIQFATGCKCFGKDPRIEFTISPYNDAKSRRAG